MRIAVTSEIGIMRTPAFPTPELPATVHDQPPSASGRAASSEWARRAASMRIACHSETGTKGDLLAGHDAPPSSAVATRSAIQSPRTASWSSTNSSARCSRSRGMNSSNGTKSVDGRALPDWRDATFLAGCESSSMTPLRKRFRSEQKIATTRRNRLPRPFPRPGRSRRVKSASRPRALPRLHSYELHPPWLSRSHS